MDPSLVSSDATTAKPLKGFTRTFAGRTGVIGVVVMALLIPLWLVQDVIEARKSRFDEVAQELGAGWGPVQQIVAPVLVLPASRKTMENGQSRSETVMLVVEPRRVDISADLSVRVLARGIYSTLAYETPVAVSATFRRADIDERLAEGFKPEWSRALFGVSASSARHVRQLEADAIDPEDLNRATLRLRDQLSTSSDFLGRRLDDAERDHILRGEEGQEVVLESRFQLRGSESFHVRYGQAQTKIDIKGDWASPSFTGSQLPDERELGTAGFRASWTVTPGVQRETARLDQPQIIGVDLKEPVSIYRKITRIADYGILLVVLTYTALTLFEFAGRAAVHPVQYLLLGCALCLFYLLLLSTAEVIGFGLAYLFSAAAVVGQVALYISAVAGRLRGVTVGALIAAQYGLMYLLLNLENYPLLIGAWVLFLALSAVMWFTRRTDWSGLPQR
jgi:inner membrane protein